MVVINLATVLVHGKKTGHNLLINDASHLSPLCDVRKLFTAQDIRLGFEEFSFMTPTGGVVSTKQEEVMDLKDICTFPDRLKPTDSSSETGLDHNDERLKKGEHIQFSIIPVKMDKEKEKASGVKKEGTASGESQDGANPFESDDIPGTDNTGNGTSGFEDPNSANGSSRGMEPPPSFTARGCPFRRFKDVFNVHEHLNFPTVLRVLFVLLFALLVTMFLTVCTFHLILTAAGGMDFQSPLLQVTPHGSTDSVTELRLKLQHVELESAFKIQELEKRLAELEDMYLRDLKHLTHKIADLKARLGGSDGDQAMFPEDSVLFEHNDVPLEKTSRPDVVKTSPEL